MVMEAMLVRSLSLSIDGSAFFNLDNYSHKCLKLLIFLEVFHRIIFGRVCGQVRR